MPTPDILRASEQFNAALLAREQYAFEQMATMYASLERRLLADIELLAREVWEKGMSPSRMQRMERYKTLLAQARDEFTRYGEFSADLITVEQRAAIDMSLRHAEQLTRMSMKPGTVELMTSWNRLPADALQAMVGFAGDGSPLRPRLAEVFGDYGEVVRETLLKGVGLGWHPTKTARAIRDQMQGALDKALTWARTEQIRASREASRQSYEKNAHIIKGYTRHATKDERTCMACLMLDGTFYPMTPEHTLPSLPDHPRGRCTLLPETIGYSDILGVPVPESEPSTEPTGRQWFEALPEAQQRAYMDRELGKGAWEAWRGGRFQLEDIPHLVENEQWGNSYGVTRLSGLVGKEAAQVGTVKPALFSDIMSAENDIRARSTEALIVWDTNGKRILDATGGKDYIELTPEKEEMLRDSIVTHNHPAGSSFSESDIRTAQRFNVNEMRVVTSKWRYSMRPPESGWGSIPWDKIQSWYSISDYKLRNTMQELIVDGEISLEDANQEHVHRVWMLVARKLGLNYRAEPITE
jgi:SPP1 gp7 family putative phage head morphogenesis protein